MSEQIKRVLDQYGASEAFKPIQTLRQFIVTPKDKIPTEENCNVVYRCPCRDCDKVYIGETKKKLGDRIKQHTADTVFNQLAIHEHYKLAGRLSDKANVTVLCLEEKKNFAQESI